ncbi:hypothetical protein [Mycoplasma hafezii]|uniref:hypothetical protein n=1 Tax=Mycoplasma hafezii TaxID=525886 RepID=UPI003CEA2E51
MNKKFKCFLALGSVASTVLPLTAISCNDDKVERSEYDKKAAEVQELQNKLNEKTTLAAQLETEKATLAATVETHSKTVEELTKNKTELENKIAALVKVQEELKKAQAEKAAIDKQLADAKDDSKSQIDELTTKKEELENKIKTLEETSAKGLNDSKAELEKSKAEVAKALDEAQKAKVAAEAKLQEKAANIAQLETEKAALTSKLAETESKLAEATKQLKEANENNETLQKQVAALQKEKADLKAKADKLQVELVGAKLDLKIQEEKVKNPELVKLEKEIINAKTIAAWAELIDSSSKTTLEEKIDDAIAQNKENPVATFSSIEAETKMYQMVSSLEYKTNKALYDVIIKASKDNNLKEVLKASYELEQAAKKVAAQPANETEKAMAKELIKESKAQVAADKKAGKTVAKDVETKLSQLEQKLTKEFTNADFLQVINVYYSIYVDQEQA